MAREARRKVTKTGPVSLLSRGRGEMIGSHGANTDRLRHHLDEETAPILKPPKALKKFMRPPKFIWPPKCASPNPEKQSCRIVTYHGYILEYVINPRGPVLPYSGIFDHLDLFTTEDP